jgi:ABC-2 type transport system ATP-binding protein
MAGNIIEITNLTKYYGKSRGVIDISFDIKEGEIFGFIGPNGAGKSTTIRTLLNLIHPTSGECTIFGLDTRKYPAKIAEEVGYIPSEIFYYDNMRVKELLKYSASFYKKDSKKRMNELVELMELDVNKRIRDLSLGNKKKVGIVQGLMHEPRLIILDEPTSGLDPLMQQRFFDLILDENKKGSTVLFSSHILNEVQKLSHRVGIVKDGYLIKLEDMNTLREKTYKRVMIESTTPIDQNLFHINGTRDFKLDGDKLSFLYSGDINLLTEKIASLSVSDLLIDDPDLEEIFMHYYEREA